MNKLGQNALRVSDRGLRHGLVFERFGDSLRQPSGGAADLASGRRRCAGGDGWAGVGPSRRHDARGRPAAKTLRGEATGGGSCRHSRSPRRLGANDDLGRERTVEQATEDRVEEHARVGVLEAELVQAVVGDREADEERDPAGYPVHGAEPARHQLRRDERTRDHRQREQQAPHRRD